jgi:hypothetical protein
MLALEVRERPISLHHYNFVRSWRVRQGIRVPVVRVSSPFPTQLLPSSFKEFADLPMSSNLNRHDCGTLGYFAH